MTFLNESLRRSGFALILVLWVLSLLTIMAGSFALSMRRETSIIETIKNNAEALSIAESGIAIAEMMLLLPDKTKRWRTDGSIYQIDTANAQIRLRLLAENGKIDINHAEQKLLESLMASAPLSDSKQKTQLVGAILDWRDEDDLIHIEGAEKKEYREAGLNYQPRNKPFQSIGELQLVLGMDEAIYKWLEPLITVYSGQPTVNLQQATKEVLQVLPDLDASLIEDYMAARLASAKQDLPAPPFPATGLAQTAQGGQSQVFTVTSEVLLDDGAAATLSAVIQSAPSATAPFVIIDWQRNKGEGESLFADILADTDTLSDLIVKHYDEPEFNN
ncbi:MAG: type II secretion system protein GspK [Methylovulum sp.]|nr:type II secretion system protein GspK [Methylovulum sp.]